MSATVRAGYKQTDVGVIPQDWDSPTLDTIAKRGSGHTPDKQHPEYWNGNIKWISLKDSDVLDQLYIEETAASVTPAGVANSSAVVHPAGTVVLSRDAGVGKSAIMKSDMAVSQHFMAWQCGSKLDNIFLYYWLQAKKLEFERIAMGNTIKTIGLPYFRSLRIPSPPLPEQRAIATALSDVDALLAKLDALIAKKRDLKVATMLQLLTGQTRLPGFGGEWEVKRLGELLSYEQPTNYLVSSSEYSDANDVPVLTAGKTFVLGYTNEMEGIFAELPAIIFDDFTTATKYVTFPFKAKSSAMKILKPRSPSVNLRLVYEIMQVIDFKLGDHKRYWISEYSKVAVKIPSAAEQTAIATVLSDMDTELTALEARRDKTRALKQGMMQELLTGRIRLLAN